MQRMTKQRASIIELMRNHNGFLSAQDVFEQLRQTGIEVGLATVYRNLQAMAESHIVDVLRPDGTDTQLFRYCAEDAHHHHLVCRCCGKTVDLVGNDFEGWAKQIAAQHGFTRVSHSLELFGQCADCTDHESRQDHTL
ncbi:Fur family transcriptional regulator [Arcanobacterium hippocoleae]|uniref:Fur family ferric uptake transcriptional regulator n=1 Tax=Arcanobacterium hippocoleae TaxID=149017 RepID=A0ABU1T113_9ACTO|nr:Fur family transcriptional regulator [Arcanobacterium hippocoleae]MDR6938989.1 Fur family ferric uptake transcriptional regulator [Arcanobacterium hippocoleae]